MKNQFDISDSIEICEVDIPVVTCIRFFSSPEPKAHKVSLQYTNGPLSSVVVFHTFKLEYLWGQLANLD